MASFSTALNSATSRTMRRVAGALCLSGAAFVVWLIPSYIVMSPDSNYSQRVLREAELVAAAIARGGMTSIPSSKIGNPKDPRIIAAKKRSPFHKNRTEGIMRQMHSIINKRIVLYDHRRRIVLDSFDFYSRGKINAARLSAPKARGDTNTKDNAAATLAASEQLRPPDYLPPPKGNNKIVLSALRGNTMIERIVPNHNTQAMADDFTPVSKKFQPKQSILLVSVPVRRLRLVQGAVVLLDQETSERTAWRWRSLLQDNLPFFAAMVVALSLLLLWLRGAFVVPLARLAYRAEKSGTQHSNELAMLSHRQELGQLTARNFAHSTTFLKKTKSKQTTMALADSEMASLIHTALIDEKFETTSIALVVQQVVNRQNTREREHTLRKTKKINASQGLTYKHKVQLQTIKANGHSNPWQLPLFSRSIELCLDYFVQAASLAQSSLWESSVRLALVRNSKTIDLIIEDDGEDIKSPTLSSWLKRSLEESQFTWTKASIEKTLAMNGGTLTIASTRPPRLKLSLPLGGQKIEN